MSTIHPAMETAANQEGVKLSIEKRKEYYDRVHDIVQHFVEGDENELKLKSTLAEIEANLTAKGIVLKQDVPQTVGEAVERIVKVLDDECSDEMTKMNLLQQIFSPRGAEKLEFRYTELTEKTGKKWAVGFIPPKPMREFLWENCFSCDFPGIGNDKKAGERSAVANFLRAFGIAIQECCEVDLEEVEDAEAA